MKTVIDRYFLTLQHMIVDYLDFVMKPAAARSTVSAEEMKEPTLSKPQIERHDRLRRIMLETLVTLCTKYNPLYMFSIERSTWDALLSYFLKFRRKPEFQMQFYRLLHTGFRLGVESVVLDIILYQNMIGSIWDIVQERERDTIVYKDQPHNELFHNLITRMITFLESIEGNRAYPIMNKQFTVNLAWKKLKEFRARGKDPAGANDSTAKSAMFGKGLGRSPENRKLLALPSLASDKVFRRLSFRSTTMLPGLLPMEKERRNSISKHDNDRKGTGRKK